ncbi:MAG: efflux RND transporter permease subunit, partial [Myxococcales bacterium]|nr:efflux RND transporter permease subunit [Myxococcales bacterium]
GDVDHGQLLARAHELRRALETRRGVTKVTLCGPTPRIHIALDPERARAYNLSLADVTRALSDALVGAAPRSLDELGRVVVRVDAGGRPINLGDVATMTHEYTPECGARVDERPGVSGAVWPSTGGSATGDRDPGAIERALAEFAAERAGDGIDLTVLPPSRSLTVTMDLPPGTARDPAEALARRVEVAAKALADRVLVELDASEGGAAPTLTVTLIPAGDASLSSSAAQLRQQLAAIPELLIANVQLAGRPDPARSIAQLAGPELETLHALAGQLAALAQQSGAFEARARGGPSPQRVIELDRAQLAAAGLSTQAVAELIQAASVGVTAGSIAQGEATLPIVVTMGEGGGPLDTGFLELTIPTDAGAVPLRSLVTVRLDQEYPQMQREDRQRVVEVILWPRAAETSTGELRARVARELELPPGYTVRWP